MSEKKTFEIARETLRQLTVRKLAPTPVNYKAIYNEIAQIPMVEAFPTKELKDIALALPAKTPGQQKQRALLESAIERMHWDGVKAALMAYGSFTPNTGAGDAATESVVARALPGPLAATAASVATASPLALTSEFLAQIAQLIAYAQPAFGSEDTHFLEQTNTLVQALRSPTTQATSAKRMLADYSHRLSFVAEDQAEIKKSLVKLLRMVFESMAALDTNDTWLQSRVDALTAAAGQPLTLRLLDDLEQQLKDLVAKQTDAKDKAQQAHNEAQQLLASFINRLAQMTTSTGLYQQKLQDSARQIEQATALADIAPVLQLVAEATRSMAQDSQDARDELHSIRSQSEQTQAELVKLHEELDRLSMHSRHDPLTGALNRKGLEEALEREIATVRRKEEPLCAALLDIDNFKSINDSVGQSQGDEALKHLATVARAWMRPQDVLARFGGEAFVVLLPDTLLEPAIEAMTHLQRELSKNYFMNGTDKLLITFSAGVVQVMPEEAGMEAIRRADKAMYLAKRAGKNRVVAA